MADQNDDWKSETTPSSGRPAGLNEGIRSNGKASTNERVRESGARIASEAKHYAGDMATRAKEKGRSMFEQQKDSAVGQVDSVAHAFRGTADQLQEEGQAQAARYIGIVADQLESFGGRLREKDLDTLIDDAQSLARRAPGTFFVGTVAAGFLLARFLKSSSERRYDYMGMSDDEWAPPSTTEPDRFAATSGDRGFASDVRAPGAGSTPGTVAGTMSVGTTPPSSPSLSGSDIGGNSHDNR